ncbi:hypothetical protein ACFXGA_38565 [Actinosynnema sp. NPDC059335]|uniref:hypothetical protein n=1 Tax=Actinosynnema sp. NPDC059335 TaxID=3346804 RepID=UPI00366B5A40
MWHLPQEPGADLVESGIARGGEVPQAGGPGRTGAGFDTGKVTAYRYHDEAVTVLADQAPDPHDALRRDEDEGLGHVVLGEKVFSADRLRGKTTSAKGGPQ